MRINEVHNAKITICILIVVILTILSTRIEAQQKSKITSSPNNTGIPKDSIPKLDVIKNKKPKDSTLSNKIDTLNISKDSLDAPVKYAADDSGVLIIPTKQFLLYGKSKVGYKDMSLNAAVIEYSASSQFIKAYGALDTTNNPQNKPKLIQGEMTSISDSILFNMKNLKGLTKNTYYQEGELFVNAQKLKKVDKDIFYAYRGRFTTCNLDTPHYAIRTRKMKLINNKIAVSGPAAPEFEGVPIPIGIPFGIYPLARGRHSGILTPQFTSSEDFGLGLDGLGYYKVLSSNADATLRTSFYSYGGWSINLNNKYLKRYHYTGSVNIAIQNTRSLNHSTASFGEFNTSKSFMINWNHQRDNRARPGTNFSASLNFGSTKYNQNIINNPTQNFQNQLSSSVSYSKDWRGKSNISINLNHNQNSYNHLVNFNFPTVTYNVVTLYPFQKKEKVGTLKWYENIGLGYSGNLSNQFSFYDTSFSLKRIIDTVQWGATHNIPISITLPPLGPLTISPSVTYQERWYGQEILKKWDIASKKLDTTIHKGIYRAGQTSFGIGINTRIFGTYQFSKDSKIKAIRHEVRPNIGFSYTPDLNSKNYYSTQVDSTGRQLRFSRFDGVIPGAFSEGNFGGISFGVDNLLEMKVADKTDTTKGGTKKVKLIDGFGFNSSYNLLADSFALSTFNIYARSTLFEKVNITASAILDPYAVDRYGYRKKNLLWYGKNFNPGRITSGNIAISTQFKSKPKDEKSDKSRLPVDPFMTPDEQQRQLQFTRSNPAEYTDFNIPWSISLSYSLNFNRTIKSDYSGFQTNINSSLNFNGDFSLTPKWKMGANGYFDFNTGKLNQLSTFITREMHCWQLAINVTPIGPYRSFSFTISPKSGILRDLRINRSRMFSN